MKPILNIAFALSLVAAAVNADCYFPNGDSIPDTPCNPDAKHSTCCGPGYACLSNNVCALTEHVTPDIRKLSSYYVRASCTDKTWSAQECPSFCMNSNNGDNTGIGGMGVGKCDGDGGVDRYYCRDSQTANMSNNAICQNSSLYIEFPGFPTTVTIIGVEATSTPSNASSRSASTTPATDQSPLSSPTSTPKNNSVALGAGLGVGLGLPLLAALVAIVLLVRRRRNSPSSDLGAAGASRQVRNANTPRTGAEKWAHQSSRGAHEVTGDYGMHEAPSEQVDAYELAAKEWKAI